MKFIFTADWHVKLYSDKQFDEQGIPLRLNEIFSSIEYMCKYAIENDIDTMIIGGDTNDLKGILHVRAFVMLKNILTSYTDKIKFIFLHGNHDSSSKSGTESAIELLVGDGIEAYTTTTAISEDILLIPFSNHMVDDIVNSDPYKIMISHFGLSDASLSSGISIRTSIKKDDLAKYELVLLGHYHKPQQVGHVWYSGSPIQLRRDEHDEEKRFLVIDTENPSDVKSIPTKGYRKYYEIVLEKDISEEDATKLLEQAKKFREDGNFVTVRKRDKELPVGLNDELQKEFTIIDEYEEEYQIRGITMAMSDEERMTKYLEIKNIQEAKRAKYLEIGLRVLKREV